MKRREVVKRIATEAKRQGVMWVLARQGANHEVYTLDSMMIPIPRHRELGEGLVIDIFKERQDILGKGWWRQ